MKPLGASTRGVDYWRGGPGNSDRRIFAIRGEYLYALDAATGQPVQTFGAQGRVSLRFADRQPLAGRFNDSTGPLVLGNVVVVDGKHGGRRRWRQHERRPRQKTCAASTPKPASFCGRSTWCRGRASSATRPGAMTPGSSRAISARGTR